MAVDLTVVCTDGIISTRKFAYGKVTYGANTYGMSRVLHYVDVCTNIDPAVLIVSSLKAIRERAGLTAALCAAARVIYAVTAILMHERGLAEVDRIHGAAREAQLH